MIYTRLLIIFVMIVARHACGAELRGVVIAHRSASGYLPEHTLAGAAMAHALQADFIEPDVVLSKDNVPIVLHDIYLDTTTNVAKKFANRNRPDGRWYAIDFKLDEIRTLKVHERRDFKTGQTVFPNRFPSGLQLFHVPTLEEVIELVDGLNQSTKRIVGLYPEVKAPDFHKKEGRNIAEIVIRLLEKHRRISKEMPIYVQCFDPSTLIYIRKNLNSSLPLIQLIGASETTVGGIDYKAMLTEKGLKDIATYANGIAPSISHVLQPDLNSPIGVSPTSIVRLAHQNKLVVHAYTVRRDELPAGVSSMGVLMKLLFDVAKVDGVFTDFPDEAIQNLKDIQLKTVP